MALTAPLTPENHNRDTLGMTYVYPVVSRRAGGVSVGVNLNPNNACNWACLYCQVPDLVRGTAPDIDLAQLEAELRTMLTDILHGDFMQKRVPEEVRRLNDIALSGNGEPTTAKVFPQVIELIGRVMADFDLIGKIRCGNDRLFQGARKKVFAHRLFNCLARCCDPAAASRQIAFQIGDHRAIRRGDKADQLIG